MSGGGVGADMIVTASLPAPGAADDFGYRLTLITSFTPTERRIPQANRLR